MATVLTAAHARRLRVRSQLLAGSTLPPAAVVDRAGALQGQSLPAVLRAIALRSRPGTTVADVRDAFDRGELVRSWPMRGTLFATTPRHLATLLAVTGERTHRATATRRARLGVADPDVARARDVLLDALAGHPMTRAEVLRAWRDCGVDVGDGRGYHLLMHLSTAGLVHWGPFASDGSEQLLVPTTTSPPGDPEAGLVDVVRAYVAARAPVGEADLAWWTKLPRTLLRRAVARVEGLVTVEVRGAPAWVLPGDEGAPGPASPALDPGPDGVRLLPAFDEWLLGYADRSLTATPAALEAVVPGGNGVFRPLVLVDGRLVGTWSVQRTGPRAGRPHVDLVAPVPERTLRAVERAADAWTLG